MFSRRLLSVVNMDPEYMAHHDGSEQAEGRGSGKDPYEPVDQLPWGDRPIVKSVHGSILERADAFDEQSAVIKDYGQSLKQNKQMYERGKTPYMNMTYAPLERRIDVAIHRAMFASSTRQARQFVIHGAVKVNGQVVRVENYLTPSEKAAIAKFCPQQMTHPSYLLNPGDMFQVNRESVLYATGKKKSPPPKEKSRPSRASKAAEETEEGDVEADETADGAAETEAKAAEPADPEQTIKQLKFLARTAKKVIAEDKDNLKVRKKQRLRAFIKEAREALAKMGRKDADEVVNTDLVGSVNEMLKELVIQDPNAAAKAEEAGGFTAEATADAKKAAEEANAEKEASKPVATEKKEAKTKTKHWDWHLSEDELALMKEELNDFDDNPYDPTKRYATPWQPRRYMSAFAFIPRYLEVNQNICAAVYLRHPVARQGFAEVPSPFPPHVMQLAFNWYLRRR